jgi:hypothetical protein
MGYANMTYRLSTDKLYKLKTILSTLFEIPHGLGGYHYINQETLPQWAADHVASTGDIPEEFKAKLMGLSDRSECFEVKTRTDGPGVYVIFYMPVDGFLH